jgi:glycosyltransferase involved in cell wall biosynthesis
MKILYDYISFLNKVSGASRSFCEVANILKNNHDVIISTKFSENIYLKEIFGYEKKFLNGYHFKGRSKLLNKIEELHAISIIKRNNFDILHSTGESIYFEKYLKKPFVVTFHDMIPENYLTNSPRLPLRKILLERANRIICVSENTKIELLDYYQYINPTKIDVVYHGINQDFIDYIDVNIENYILYVGERNDYKNFNFTIEALIPLLSQNKELNIVCTGKPFTKSELEFFNQYKITNQLINVGFVSNKQLFSLYKNALLFIYPSKYEGFGIPLLEAMVNDCPLCISNSSCFPEIAGECAMYFEPENKESILYAVKYLIENHEVANKLRLLGKERVKEFTWEKSADEMIKCYQKSI